MRYAADIAEAHYAHKQGAFAFHPLDANGLDNGNRPAYSKAYQHNTFKRTHIIHHPEKSPDSEPERLYSIRRRPAVVAD